jgi:hypothetical protein
MDWARLGTDKNNKGENSASILRVLAVIFSEMLLSYSFKCGPITAHIYQMEAGWKAVVQLFGSEISSRERILDLTAAQNTAMSYARELCRDHNLTYPGCLDAPRWIMARSAA